MPQDRPTHPIQGWLLIMMKIVMLTVCKQSISINMPKSNKATRNIMIFENITTKNYNTTINNNINKIVLFLVFLFYDHPLDLPKAKTNIKSNFVLSSKSFLQFIVIILFIIYYIWGERRGEREEWFRVLQSYALRFNCSWEQHFFLVLFSWKF